MALTFIFPECQVFFICGWRMTPSLMLHQEWIAACVRRGVFFTTHHNHFLNYALSDEDIAQTVAVADEAFFEIRQRHPRE